ncbi:MAG: CRTAC1 family protein [Candidatus Thermoplasmatota archaeon]|nr:CRTAC1 family protein [Candidatus Thermoplasmatota archaeon]
MRPVLVSLLVALLVSCGPANAGFELVTDSGLDEINLGPLTNWATYGPGVAWGDYDQDGDLDVFLTARFDHLGQETALALGFSNMGEIPSNHSANLQLMENSTGQSHLLRNDGNGHFVDVSEEVGVGSTGVTTLGATWVDFDGDGDVDLYLSNYGRADLDYPEGSGEQNQMFQNENGSFTDVTSQSNLGNPGHSSASVWADYDHDGDMDCYSLNFGMIDELTGLARRETNIMYRNDGDSNGDGVPEFSDQTRESGTSGQIETSENDFVPLISAALSVFPTSPMNPSSQAALPEIVSQNPAGSGMSWAALWFDADGDGWEDLYVASDFGISPLYRNNRDGTFEVATSQMGMSKPGTGMGAHAADIDLDGDLDVCQSNFGDNFLWNNQGDVFIEQSSMGIYGEQSNILVNWDCHFFDYDLDGDMDLWFGVGRINLDYSNQYNSLYRNDGDTNGDGLVDFTDVATDLGISGADMSSGNPRGGNKTMGVALADFDNDGDLDLLMAHANAPPQLWRNTAVEENLGGWLKVSLQGVEGGSNSHGVGCVVEVHLEDGTILKQHVYAGDGFLGSSDPTINFGLGNRSIEVVKVKWSTGYIQTIQGVQVNSELTVVEELPSKVVDYSNYLLAIMVVSLIILWNSPRRNQL